MRTYNVAVVGATGVVGSELVRLLASREFPVEALRLLASERSLGRMIPFRNRPHRVELVVPDAFEGVDLAFFAAGAARSRQFAPYAVRAGALVIDNSSAFRLESSTPLVIPEINPADIDHNAGIIANPNCSTILLLMALAPIRKLAPIRRVVVSTYQAASGAGAQAMQELLDQTHELLHDRPINPRIFPHQIAFNLFSHNSSIDDSGYNDEERKMMAESRKILHEPGFRLTATCVRVPVLRAHTESVNVEFDSGERPTLESIRSAWEAFPGINVVDDRDHNYFPMPADATDSDCVLAGRLRDDPSCDAAIEFLVCGDQTLKGAALNALQIAEHWMRPVRV